MNVVAGDIFCVECGYDLRGLASARCPECGIELDRGAMGRSRLKWARRKTIGRVPAYLATVWSVIARTRRVADEVAGPVSLDDAREFARVTALLAWLGPAALAVWWYQMIRLATQGGPWREAVSGLFYNVSMPSLAPTDAPVPHAWLGWALQWGIVASIWLGWWLF